MEVADAFEEEDFGNNNIRGRTFVSAPGHPELFTALILQIPLHGHTPFPTESDTDSTYSVPA